MKKNTRIKLTAPAIRNGTDVVAAMDDIRTWSIERMTLFAEFEAATKAVDDAHRPRIDALGDKLQARTEQLRAYAIEHPEMFGDKRSIETIHGTLGWRTGQWQCDKLSGWIWQAGKKTKAGAKTVLDAIKRRFAGLYIRTKEEVDCDALIAARGMLTAEQLSGCGVRIFQEEAFYVDPKLEDTNNRQTS